jgi:hypothetical protein
MLRDFFKYPSFYSLVVTGIVSLIVLVMLIANFQQLGKYQIMMASCGLAIVIGVHGILHALYETDGAKPALMF